MVASGEVCKLNFQRDHEPSGRKSVRVVRLSADEDGQSRFDSVQIDLVLQQFAPPAAPLFVSEVRPALGYVVLHLPPRWIGEPHPSPHRQMLFCLAGTMKVTSSVGEVRIISAGEAWLMGDTLGLGHRTEVVSDKGVDAVVIQLA